MVMYGVRSPNPGAVSVMDDVEHHPERPGLNFKLGDNSSLPPLCNNSLRFVLTSDAQYSKAELHSQLVQPYQLWYGKVNPGSRQMKLMSGNGTGCSQSEEKGILDPVVVPTGKGTMAADNSSLPPLCNNSLRFVLTSDAQYSKAELHSKLVQPYQLWYGKVNPGSRQMKLMSGNGTGCSQSEEKGILDPVVVPTGKGTMAAILDSGINTGHMAFQGMSEKISPCSKSFVGGDIKDKLGHGTHCAGLFCGNPTELPIPGPNTNSVMPFGGIAPDAKDVMVPTT